MPTDRRRLQPEVQRINKTLGCELSLAEVNAHALRAAKLDEEIFDEREQNSARQKASKALVDDLSRERGEALRKVRTGKEDRKVNCERTFDFSENAVVTVRLDTGEEIDRRAMTYDERQQALFPVPDHDGPDTSQMQSAEESLRQFRDEEREAESGSNERDD